jgi:hypothetical protein
MIKERIIMIIRLLREDSTFRRKALFISALVGLYVLIIPVFFWNQSAKKDLKKILTKNIEFASLADEYQTLNKDLNRVERKKSLTAPTNLSQSIADITISLGIKEKIKSIKGTGIKKISQQMTEESAEIQLNKLNATELVYLFQKIENAPTILSVKRVVIKKSFENPDLLDVTTAVSLFK